MLHLEVYKNISSLKSDMAGNWGNIFQLQDGLLPCKYLESFIFSFHMD